VIIVFFFHLKGTKVRRIFLNFIFHTHTHTHTQETYIALETFNPTPNVLASYKFCCFI